MNSKFRCAGCKKYFPMGQAISFAGSRVCTKACQQTVLERRQRPAETVTRTRSKPKSKRSSEPSSELKAAIRKRDGNACRWCGIAFDLHVHHINYRSEGGDNQSHNLITLCGRHHGEVHSDKKRYKRICLAYVWLLLVENESRHLPGIERLVSRLDSHTASR